MRGGLGRSTQLLSVPFGIHLYVSLRYGTNCMFFVTHGCVVRNTLEWALRSVARGARKAGIG